MLTFFFYFAKYDNMKKNEIYHGVLIMITPMYVNANTFNTLCFSLQVSLN